MSWLGSRALSTIQRPMRMCHQKSGSCSRPMNRPRMTVITPPSISVLALRRSVNRKPSAAREGVREVAGGASCIGGMLVGERGGEDALPPPDPKQLADDEVGDGDGAQPAGRRQ